MRIIADENIPLVDEFFGPLGEVTRVSGRAMNSSLLKNADLLLVRSITKVNKDLLSGTSVKFVATATIGVDHIDIDYLKKHKIGFANAPGSNASSVVEYVVSALDVLREQFDFDLFSRKVGIIGHGNVGSGVKRRLESFGLDCIAYDPILKDEGVKGLCELDDVLKRDIILMHAPITKTGPYPTKHLMNHSRLKSLKPGTILLNAGRGAVLDNKALLDVLNKRSDLITVLDVWEKEPHINVELAKKVTIATPHIAGYSLDGKMCGTDMIYKAACQYLGLPRRKKLGQFLPESHLRKMSFSSDSDPDYAVSVAVRSVYDIRRDHYMLMRTLNEKDETVRGKAFDALRKNYPGRREFAALKAEIRSPNAKTVERLKALGFRVKES